MYLGPSALVVRDAVGLEQGAQLIPKEFGDECGLAAARGYPGVELLVGAAGGDGQRLRRPGLPLRRLMVLLRVLLLQHY